MENVCIGADNGLSGGLVALSWPHGLIIAKLPMPIRARVHAFEKTKIKRTKGVARKVTEFHRENEIDALALIQWIDRVTDSKPCRIVIEECPEHAKQKSTMRSMAMSYGILIGSISAALPTYSLHIVRSGNPLDSWQRKMMGALSQGDTKSAALAKARELWPDEDWLATPRSSTPHTGLVDAALIAQFHRTQTLEP